MAEDLTFLPPSIDPVHRQSIYGTIKFIVDKMVKQDMDNMLPGKVVAVDRETNRVTVELMVTMINTARQVIKRAQIASIPIYSPSAGGFVINFPIQQGDLGWVKATDTDISLFLQTLISTPAAQPPNTFITHKFDSALFFPDNMNKSVTIDEEDADNLVIQKYDGSVKISISDTGIAINGVNDTHALFDMHSTTQASIPWPRMTVAQRNAIPSPQDGMAVWVTDTHYLSTYDTGSNTWS